jgi:hypothetical protein
MRQMWRAVLNRLFQFWYTFIEKARATRGAPTKHKGDRVIAVPRAAGPVVESPHGVHPLSRIPHRSTKADAKRAAHKYAERVAGRPLSWKAARKLLDQLGRLERDANAQ